MVKDKQLRDAVNPIYQLKRQIGNPKINGSLSYLAPILSTLALVAIDSKPFTILYAAVWLSSSPGR